MTLVSSFHSEVFPAAASMASSSELTVEHQTRSGTRRFSFAPTDVGERTTAFLRRRYPSRTVDNVVADLAAWDVKHATVARMLERQTSPGSILWLALIWAYGPEFLSEVHPAPLGWLSEAAREQKQREIEAKIEGLRAELEQLR